MLFWGSKICWERGNIPSWCYIQDLSLVVYVIMTTFAVIQSSFYLKSLMTPPLGSQWWCYNFFLKNRGIDTACSTFSNSFFKKKSYRYRFEVHPEISLKFLVLSKKSFGYYCDFKTKVVVLAKTDSEEWFLAFPPTGIHWNCIN